MTPLTDRQKKIITAATEAGKQTSSLANTVAITEAAHAAMLIFDEDLPITDEESHLFFVAYTAAYTHTQLIPSGAFDTLPVEFGFTEGPLGVVTDGHRYQIRVFDQPIDDPTFFIFEYFNDAKHPRILYERAVKLTLSSWREIDKWMRARQRRQAKDRQ